MKAKKIKKVKKPTVSKVKKEAWEAFSKYIRLKGSIDGFAICITCNTSKPWKEIQAGHFIPGRHPSILFDERNVWPQCYRCNVGLKGNWVPYRHKMVELYGEEIIAELELLDKQPHQFKVFELLEIRDRYREKVKDFND